MKKVHPPPPERSSQGGGCQLILDLVGQIPLLLEKFFFSPPEILSILHAWLYRHFLVIFLEKFMIFCKKTKKFFFNVNPYHFQTHAWLYRHKKKFFSKGICQLLVFFFPKKKKKKIFFFRVPKFLKKPCEEKVTKNFFSTKKCFQNGQTFLQ